MSLPNYLAKIKSSGIYRFVWDKSEITATEAETLRLVVGYSEKGPFNTPVYIETQSDFVNIFGGISRKLEKRGIFFHRVALQSLAAGPILAMNIKPFSNEKISYVTANGAESFSDVKHTMVSDVYNTSRFWNIDPDKLLDIKDEASDANSNYLTIATTDTKESSNTIFMRPCQATGYDVTIKSWYTALGEDMPDYFAGYENMQVSDFFAEIYVFNGKFTPAIATSMELKDYFKVVDNNVVLKQNIKDAFGNTIDTLEALASNENSNFVQKYQGVLLPDFKNTSGAYISLDLVFNSDYDTHKMIMKFNADLLDEETIHPTDISTNGWNKLTAEDITKLKSLKLDEVPGVNILSEKKIIPSVAVYNVVTQTNADTFDSVNSIVIDGYEQVLDRVNFDVNGEAYEVGDLRTQDATIAVTSTSEYPDLTLFEVQDSPEGNKLILTGNASQVYANIFNVGDRFIVKVNNTATVVTLVEKEVKQVKQESSASNDPSMTGPDSTTSNLVAKLELSFDTQESITLFDNCLIRCNNKLQNGIESPLTYLEGYVYTTISNTGNKMMDKLKRQNTIFDTIVKNYPGLLSALTNRVDVDYRYIVDTFETYPVEEAKSKLALIAKKKDNCLLLTNFPSMQTLIKSGEKSGGEGFPSFTDKNGNFNAKFLKLGGNPTKLVGKKFSLPSAENGASWCSFNTPVVFSDGAVKVTVPAAGLVSNNFMAKYEGRQPYYIVAGPTYGRLSYPGMVGPDYNYDRPELDILEPMGVNATVFVPRKGTFINSNQTAKQNPVTALSKINVRELVTYLQDQIEDLLQTYQWEFNTADLRNTIKKRADKICELVQLNGGIYAYSNQCDELNNTDDVINNEMIVLHTSIEPGMGCGKMVQELTIYKKGGMSSVITQQ